MLSFRLWSALYYTDENSSRNLFYWLSYSIKRIPSLRAFTLLFVMLIRKRSNLSDERNARRWIFLVYFCFISGGSHRVYRLKYSLELSARLKAILSSLHRNPVTLSCYWVEFSRSLPSPHRPFDTHPCIRFFAGSPPSPASRPSSNIIIFLFHSVSAFPLFELLIPSFIGFLAFGTRANNCWKAEEKIQPFSCSNDLFHSYTPSINWIRKRQLKKCKRKPDKKIQFWLGKIIKVKKLL